METSTLSKLKQRAGKLIESRLLEIGTVLEVRAWCPSTLIEIDLHLPYTDMSHWDHVP